MTAWCIVCRKQVSDDQETLSGDCGTICKTHEHETLQVYNVKYEGRACIFKDEASAKDEMKVFEEEKASGATMEIKTMTWGEYVALPEFEGW